jgi:hypothetical protein
MDDAVVRGVAVPEPIGTTPLVRAHMVVGAVSLIAFMISGTYMLVHAPAMGALDPGLHFLFTSRHIYILAAALVHLILGASMARVSTPGARRVQWVGSGLLVVASGLLIAAFLVEPVIEGHRTQSSRFGLYTLFVGTILHIATGRRLRDAEHVEQSERAQPSSLATFGAVARPVILSFGRFAIAKGVSL